MKGHWLLRHIVRHALHCLELNVLDNIYGIQPAAQRSTDSLRNDVVGLSAMVSEKLIDGMQVTTLSS